MTIEEIDRDTYRNFLADSTGATIFHSLEWLKIIQEGFGIGVRLYGVWKGGRLHAVCPVEYQGPRFFPICGSPLPKLFTPYQGLVWDSNMESEERMASIRGLVKRVHAQYFRMQWQPQDSDDASYAPFDKAYTPILDLTVGEECLFKGMKGETRNQVRQAARRGVVVEFEYQNGDWVDDYIRMSISTYERQGLSTPMRKAFLKVLFKAIGGIRLEDWSQERPGAVHPGMGVNAVLALVGNKIIAASLVLFGKDTVYYLDNVSFREYQHYRANNAIMWAIIQRAANSGFVKYDLVGANVPSIAAFKFGFGAVRASFPVVTEFRGLGRLAYKVLRSVRSLREDVHRREPVPGP